MTGILAVGSLIACKILGRPLGSDLVIGGAFALFVAGLATHNSVPRAYANLAALSADTSYTLYLTHFPFLALIFFTLFEGEQFQPNWAGLSRFVGILFVTLVYAAVIWWFFERNTDRIRKLLEQRIHSRRS